MPWWKTTSSGPDTTLIQRLNPSNYGGVGIIFMKAPDDSMFVKGLVEGSGAAHSGIKVGDCLMKVQIRQYRLHLYCFVSRFPAHVIITARFL